MKKKIGIIITIVLLVFCISKGYSYLTANLSANGTVAVDFDEYRDRFLYLKAKNIGTLYTGDTDGLGTYEIYTNGSDGTNDNVSFAGFCWKIVRTTETGGTKLMYNGVLSEEGTCENTGTAQGIGTTNFNSGNTLAQVGYMYNKTYTTSNLQISSRTDDIVFANDVTYSDGTYTLTPTNHASYTFNEANWADWYNKLSYTHYTCLSDSTTCTAVAYVFLTTENYIYYQVMTGGKKIEDIIDEQIGTNGTDVNVKDSVIKTKVENWYESNILTYDDYIEDTIYCNDRSVYILQGWNPNGGSITGYLFLKSQNDKTDLSCVNVNDSFTTSTSNGNGKLKFKVGLITIPEAMYMSQDNRKTGNYYWTMTAYAYTSSISNLLDIRPNGTYTGVRPNYDTTTLSVRPVISLKNSIEISGGDGTSTSPYTIRSL